MKIGRYDSKQDAKEKEKFEQQQADKKIKQTELDKEYKEFKKDLVDIPAETAETE